MADPFLDSALDDDPDSDLYTCSISRTNGLISSISWTDNTTSKLFKTYVVNRTSGRVTSIVISVYETDGTTIGAQKTKAYTRVNGLVSSFTSTRNV